MPVLLTRDVTQQECDWLPTDLPAGTEVFVYYGYTYGCCTPNGKAVTLGGQDQLPFFEVPRDALGYVDEEAA